MKFDVEKFKKSKFVINCETKSEAKELEQMLRELGIRICYKNWFVEMWDTLKENTCYSFETNLDVTHQLGYSSIDYYKQECELDVYKFSDLDFTDCRGKQATPDNVNHPNHYQGKYECIEMMVALYGKEAVQHFCELNWFKYNFRCKNKNGEEDIKKSKWYKYYYHKLDRVDWFEAIFETEEHYKEVREYALKKYREFIAYD